MTKHITIIINTVNVVNSIITIHIDSYYNYAYFLRLLSIINTKNLDKKVKQEFSILCKYIIRL